MRLQPVESVPACSVHCLRSASIDLRARVLIGVRTIKGTVTIQNETATPVRRALVLVRWTQPDGSTHDAYASTNAKGVVVFSTTGPVGTYTLTIVNVQLSAYTFDPTSSMLQGSITVVK